MRTRFLLALALGASAGGLVGVPRSAAGDVARLELFRGLSMIRIYTPGFLARGKSHIDPVCLVCTPP